MNRRLRIKNFKLEALILWNQKDRITKFKNTNTNIKSEFARKARSKTPIEPKYKIELKVNDLVKINDGPLKGFEAKITEIDEDKGKIKVLMNMFGRETPVTLDFLQVKKI